MKMATLHEELLQAFHNCSFTPNKKDYSSFICTHIVLIIALKKQELQKFLNSSISFSVNPVDREIIELSTP